MKHWLGGKKFPTIEEMRVSFQKFFYSKDRNHTLARGNDPPYLAAMALKIRKRGGGTTCLKLKNSLKNRRGLRKNKIKNENLFFFKKWIFFFWQEALRKKFFILLLPCRGKIETDTVRESTNLKNKGKKWSKTIENNFVINFRFLINFSLKNCLET